MMYKKLMSIAALTAVVATAVTATAASAQIMSKPISFGGFAGAAIPTSDLSNGVNTGFTGGLTMGLMVPTLPFNFRIDAAYNQFGYKSNDVDNNGNGSTHFTSVTGNVVYSFGLPSAIRPYAIGGIGLYNVQSSGQSSEDAFGFNIGGGITIPLSGFNTFIEARYNRAEKNGNSAAFVPITFGVMF